MSREPDDPKHAELDLSELERLVDGDLDASETERVEAGLERSDAARRWVEERRALLARLASLRDEREPARDLWPVLAKRIRGADGPRAVVEVGQRDSAVAGMPVAEGQGTSSAASWRWLAVAATLLLALGVGFWLGRQGGWRTQTVVVDRVAVPAALDPDAATRNAMSDAEHALVEVKRELRSSLDRYRDVLPAETTRSLDANLDTIERSILELRRAIEDNPESTELRRALMSYHENEIALLKRVTRAASRL